MAPTVDNSGGMYPVFRARRGEEWGEKNSGAREGNCRPSRKPAIGGRIKKADGKVQYFPAGCTCYKPLVALAQEQVVIARPVCHDGRIEDLSAGAALPGIKSAYEIVKLLGVHSPLALRTFHRFPLVLIILYGLLRNSQSVRNTITRGMPDRHTGGTNLFVSTSFPL